MKCEHADMLIMKYMDEEISEAEAKELNTHLCVCEKCKESFMVFDSMLTMMEEVPQVTAPLGFEEEVMTKILALPMQEKRYVYSKNDKMKIALVGSFTFLLSIGAVLISYRDQILQTMMQNPSMKDFVSRLMPVIEMAESRSVELAGGIGNIFIGIDNILTAGAGLIATAILALCGVQFVLARRKNR